MASFSQAPTKLFASAVGRLIYNLKSSLDIGRLSCYKACFTVVSAAANPATSCDPATSCVLRFELLSAQPRHAADLLCRPNMLNVM